MSTLILNFNEEKKLYSLHFAQNICWYTWISEQSFTLIIYHSVGVLCKEDVRKCKFLYFSASEKKVRSWELNETSYKRRCIARQAVLFYCLPTTTAQQRLLCKEDMRKMLRFMLLSAEKFYKFCGLLVSRKENICISLVLVGIFRDIVTPYPQLE